MSRRKGKNRDFGSLKEAQYRLVEECGGPNAAAKLCGLSSTTLFNYTDGDGANAKRNMPVNVVEILEAHCNKPIVTEHLAIMANCLLLQQAPLDSSYALQTGILQTGDRVSKLFRDWAKSVEDNVIDRVEARLLLKDSLELIHILMQMRSDLEAHISDPETPQIHRKKKDEDVVRRDQ